MLRLFNFDVGKWVSVAYVSPPREPGRDWVAEHAADIPTYNNTDRYYATNLKTSHNFVLRLKVIKSSRCVGLCHDLINQ